LTDTAAADREREIKTMLRETFRGAADRLAGHKVFLFGSRATGRAEPRPDFDIGVRGDEPLTLLHEKLSTLAANKEL
jgi:predicted nucleotidyltransferase